MRKVPHNSIKYPKLVELHGMAYPFWKCFGSVGREVGMKKLYSYSLDFILFYISRSEHNYLAAHCRLTRYYKNKNKKVLVWQESALKTLFFNDFTD